MSANGGLDFQENSEILELFFSIDMSASLNILGIGFPLLANKFLNGEGIESAEEKG